MRVLMIWATTSFFTNPNKELKARRRDKGWIKNFLNFLLFLCFFFFQFFFGFFYISV